MNKIQNLKIILGRSFGKTFMYEFDFILNEETVIEILGKSISKRKCKIEAGVLECTYEIEKNINKLKSVNSNSNVIDGLIVEVEIRYNEQKAEKVFYRNKIPNEVKKVIEMVNINNEDKVQWR